MRASVVVGVMSLAGLGCVELEGFDPVGDVATISGSWLVDGQPPSPSLCEALGTDRDGDRSEARVRVTFLDRSRPITHSALFFRCRAGDFDTRPSGAGAVIAAGTWIVRLDAIDSASGELIAAGETSTWTVQRAADGETPPHIDLELPDPPDAERPVADFLSSTISTSYRVAGEDPDASRCEAVGVTTVGFVFDAAPDGVMNPAPEPCPVGLVGTRVRPGPYTLRVVGFDAGGAPVRQSAPRTLDVGVGQHVELDGDQAPDL